MKDQYWTPSRAGRLLTILLAVLIYVLLLVADAMRFFPAQIASHVSLSLSWAQLGFSAFVALLFLAVGALVWLYARDRRVALLLFGFCFTMTVTFAAETGAVLSIPIFTAITTASSALALFFLFILLLLFPRNYFSSRLQTAGRSEVERRLHPSLWLRWYLAILAVLSIMAVLYVIPYYLLPLPLPPWLNNIDFSYYAVVMASILIAIIVSYRQLSAPRLRQQHRIFIAGIILAMAPLLVLTVVPQVLNLPYIPGQFSTITFVLLPLALGYSILRYQILVLDTYLQRVVAWLIGIINLAVLGYIIFVFFRGLISSNPLIYIAGVIVAMAVLGPFVWWLAHMLTDRVFFTEVAHYRRMIETPGRLSDEQLDVDATARLMTAAAMDTFETQEVCLFVRDEETGIYQLAPASKDDDAADAPRRDFLQRLLAAMTIHEDGEADIHAAHMQNFDWLASHRPIMDIIEHVASAHRPLLLSEAMKSPEELPKGLARYLVMTPPSNTFDPLLAPIRTQGKMIGVLVLGERGDHQSYAGPDFEAIYLIEERFSSVLETARLYAQANRRVEVLDALYSGITQANERVASIEETAHVYTRIVAEAAGTGAEMWLYDKNENVLRPMLHLGTGPRLLLSEEALKPLQEADWSPWFYDGGSELSWRGPSSEVPPCLTQTPCFPFAWLPLNRGQRHFGVLALTYARPHFFDTEEKRMFKTFGDQFAAALERADFTAKLQAAYERQKELDRLKDEFITTASHELRTPLTAIVGYIELLNFYNESLPAERRAEFIARARRGCEELTLIVGNIMDASHVQIDAENIKCEALRLSVAIKHITEMLEGVTERERRVIKVDVPGDVCVRANDFRLRQILLNLFSNALKYSPPGTPIDIGVSMDDTYVTIGIRDRGPGVPPADQQKLFGRFVRLERDINSPTRGAGLGLYISKQLVEAMGGRIWVESTGIAGEGSLFAFTLQRASMPQEVHEDMAEHQEVSSS